MNEYNVDRLGMPLKVEVNVYYTIKNENGIETIVIDEEAMQEEFKIRLSDLDYFKDTLYLTE